MKDDKYSHVIRIRKSELCIVGNRTPIEGRGGGQFANHGKKPMANCVIKQHKVSPSGKIDEWVYFGELHHRQLIKGDFHWVLVLAASRHIKASEEIIWCYPKGTVLRQGLLDVENTDDSYAHPCPDDDLMSDVDLNLESDSQ